MNEHPWPAIALARDRRGARRVPFVLREGNAIHVLGSVAEADLPALRPYNDAFAIVPSSDSAMITVELRLAAPWRDVRLAQIHAELHAQGRIVGWRDEPYPLRDTTGRSHGTVERTASRFWGLLTLGVHCNGYLADAQGRPTHLWIARRAATKPTDPGRLDNLVGGGVPAGQTPREAVVREGWEEAGLRPDEMRHLVAGSVLLIDADIAEGRQVEQLHVHDLCLPAAWQPTATDGEVDEHLLLPVDEALARAAAGELTTDAALASLDFALRHRLLPDAVQAEALARAVDNLRAPSIIQLD